MKNKLFLTVGLGLALASCALAQSVPKLINYQGRLTDASGNPLPDGTYGVAFRICDSQASGQLIWGQEYNVTLIGGVFNVILGAPGGTVVTTPRPPTQNDLSLVFDSPDRFLGLTITRLADGSAISASNQREVLPRQQLLSVPFALRAVRAAIASDIDDGAVSLPKLAPRLSGPDVGIGGFAMSAPSGVLYPGPPVENPASDKYLVAPLEPTNLTVRIETTGKRPVCVMLIADPNPNAGPAVIGLSENGYEVPDNNVTPRPEVRVSLIRNDRVAGPRLDIGVPSGPSVGFFPPASVHFIDFPPPGRHTYRLKFEFRLAPRTRSNYWIQHVRLVAYEL